MAKGPLGNAPRDLRDDFVGEPAPMYDGGEPPKKARNPKKVTGNSFHAKVTGGTAHKRADRPGHFRSGGFVRGKADGGKVKKYQDGGDEGEDFSTKARAMADAQPPLQTRSAPAREPGGVPMVDMASPPPERSPSPSPGLADTPTPPLISNPPLPRPRPTPPTAGPPAPVSRPAPRPVVRPVVRPVSAAPAYPIGGPSSANYGSGGYKDGGKLTAKARQSLPSSDFALPGQGKGPKGAGSGSYPIPDRSHAANALARSSGKPVAAEVRAKVKAKYPDMGES